MVSCGNFWRPGGNRFTRNLRSISREGGFFNVLVFANLILVKGKNIVRSLVPRFADATRQNFSCDILMAAPFVRYKRQSGEVLLTTLPSVTQLSLGPRAGLERS